MFSKTLIIFFIVNFVSDSYGQKDKKFFRKDYSYIEAVEGFYKIYTVPQTWTDAKRLCALEGATFFHPDNGNEATAVLSFWKETMPNIKWLWVGLSDLLVEGVFETVNGTVISEVYSNWQPNQPDDSGGNEDCVHLGLDGTMNDFSCNTKAHFICKKSLESLEWNHNCDMPNLDYTFSKNTGKCYKLHTTPLKWTEANGMCRIDQSNLAVVSNLLEADFLAKLTESTPKPRSKGKYQRGIYHLGFHNRFKEGWQTVKGTPMNVDANVWFDNYQPDGDEHEECGAMFFNGRLININCDTNSYFICEHELHNIKPVAVSLSDAHPYVGGGID